MCFQLLHRWSRLLGQELKAHFCIRRNQSAGARVESTFASATKGFLSRTNVRSMHTCSGGRNESVSSPQMCRPPDAKNRTSGGVGGCRGAIPGTRPDHRMTELSLILMKK